MSCVRSNVENTLGISLPGRNVSRSVRGRETFLEAVRDTLEHDSTARHDEVVAQMKAFLPDGGLSFLMELRIEPVADKLRSSGA